MAEVGPLIRLLAVIEAATITGPARNLLEFAAYGRAEQIETIIATFVRGETDNLFLRTAAAQGVRIEKIAERGAWDPSAVRGLIELAGSIRPDVIQTHAVKSHFLLRRSGLHRTRPWAAFHHGYTWPTAKARVYNQLDRWSLRAPHQVLTVSQPFREELIAIGVSPYRIEVIHNAITPGWGRDAPAAPEEVRGALGIPEDRNIILLVGRLSREKDHLTLIEAVRQLPPEHRAHLLLIGEGPERPRIEARIRSLGMLHQVTLAGQRDSAQPFYRIAAVAVLSSLSEGSPNALLEAMSAGVPAVATRVGGVPEIVEDGISALLVRPSNVSEMREALAKVLSNRFLRESLARRSRELIAERHSPAMRARRLATIYRRLSEGKAQIRV